MVKGPGLYSDIGKKARGGDHKFTVTTYTSNGVAITSTGIKKGQLLLADVTTELKNKNITSKLEEQERAIAGLNFSHSDLVASLTLNDKGDTLNASYYHIVSPMTNTAVGAELTHSFSINDNSLTIGTQHALDPLTTVKARLNNYGRASALIQHEWQPKSLFTISGEVDTRAIEKSAKVGLALALKT
ncbi:Mitochondrial outer membrane protein porin 1 [Hibiscus syriacus]|uniref:Mitochondrial outer membrane protein porin 1 n=1 Tax=Hibiscus syriacus TaxID=106335 RepID=A0A6A3CMP6_HIBSY|nr:Mitochondrial outer membrane protein porin 1 [Hibiscus syriacus]